MKKLVLLTVFALSACFSRILHEIEIIRPNEIGADDSLTNRIFAISCSNGYGGVSLREVDEGCKTLISKFAFKKGYLYFSVLDKGSDSSSSVISYTTSKPVTTTSSFNIYGRGGLSAYGDGTSTTYIPQTNNYTLMNHYMKYVFVLIEENELKKWKNYYRVLDYFSPESQ